MEILARAGEFWGTLEGVRRRRSLLLISTLVLALAGCVGKVDDGGGVDGGGSTGENDSADSSGAGTDTGEMDGSGEDGSDSTTGNSELEEACAASCGVLYTCFPDLPDNPDCPAQCIDNHQRLEADCFDLELAFTSCIGGLTCDELDHFNAMAPEPYPCQAEFAARCEPALCQTGSGQGQNPGQCLFEYDCPGQDLLTVQCDGVECTCWVGEVQTGGCADAIGFCDEVGTSAANACCDWDL